VGDRRPTNGPPVNRRIWRNAAAFGMAGEEVRWANGRAGGSAPLPRGGQAGQSSDGPRAGVPHLPVPVVIPWPIRRTAQRGGKPSGPSASNQGPGAQLISGELATGRGAQGIEAEIDAEVADAVSFACWRSGTRDPSELTRYIWAELSGCTVRSWLVRGCSVEGPSAWPRALRSPMPAPASLEPAQSAISAGCCAGLHFDGRSASPAPCASCFRQMAKPGSSCVQGCMPLQQLQGSWLAGGIRIAKNCGPSRHGSAPPGLDVVSD